MSDLYGTNDAEDMSSFLQILLQNPPSSSAAAGMFGPAAEPSTSFNFSDPGCFFSGDSDRVNPSFTCKEPEASEDRAPSRSLKRSRDAEVHNLSEKNRRSRINEKLKALQTLIPNSSKTDKASMLDEAIEYLKQLQLQVQMLTLRSGVSLHSGYSMGPLLPTSAPSDGLNQGPDVYMQNTLLQPTNHMLMMPSTRNTNTSLGVLPSYGSAKMDLSRSGNNTSPGISS